MTYLLSEGGKHALAERLRQHPVLGFDLDGTLAPIGRDPEAVSLAPRIRSRLLLLARRLPVVVISGRARGDVQRRVAGIPVCEVYGNHGIEPLHSSDILRDRIAAWSERVSRRLSTWPGVWVEDKQYSVTVHYRESPEPQQAAAAARLVAAELGGARLIDGKCCLNILPAGFADKGRALLHAQRALERSTAIYFGDDETDEDVFAGCDPASVLGVRIGRKPRSRAAYFLRGQSEMEAVLRFVEASLGRSARAAHASHARHLVSPRVRRRV
ncbi:MAG: trehalose-phosphatase [Polyangia bacterium]